MPMRPPSLRGHKPAAPRPTGWTTRKSRQQRGYGRAHELMREVVLAEEPLCCPCEAAGRISASKIADHIIPKAEGGTDERTNYQGICRSCHVLKTAAEAARARSKSER